MKVIFLDIDGVMITSSLPGNFNPKCVENLKQIMQQTGCSIVVSSSYRKAGLESLRQIFTANGIEEGLVGITPVINYGIRGAEIKQYIEESRLDPVHSVDRFVILDDHDDMGELASCLILTDRRIGLDKAAANKAIQMLKD